MIDRILNSIYNPTILVVCGIFISIVVISSYESYINEQISAADLDPKLVREVNAYLRLKE